MTVEREPRQDEGALHAALRTSLLVGAIAIWHVGVEWVLVERMGPADGTALSLALLAAAVVAIAFYCEPWFAGSSLDRVSFVLQNGRLAALMLTVGFAMTFADAEARGPNLGTLAVVGVGLACLILVEMAAPAVVERWTAFVRKAARNS